MKNLFSKNREQFKEIYLNLKSHKLRTILTSFGIAWGIFILVVLLGISGGVQQGVFSLFKGFSSKTVWFYGGTSNDNISLRDTGEEIKFNFSDLHIIRELIPNITAISPDIQAPNTAVFFENEKSYYTIKGVTNNTFKLNNLKIKKGRGINNRDIKNNRNIAIVGDRIVSQFFNKHTPIGKHLLINEVDFIIVGLIDNESFLTMNEQNNIFIPYTTFSETIRPIQTITAFGVTISEGSSNWCAEKIKNYLAQKYYFNSKDAKALYVVNYEEQMSAFSKFFSGFNIFLVFVGCCLLLSGVIGVSNIMYIIVKERTREIGIKKAIGATAVTVLKEFILESLLLTLVSGLIGIVLGFGTLKILDIIIAKLLGDEQIITQTTLEVKYLVLALIVLSVSGILAGFFPAQKAAAIKPIEAMKNL